MKKKSKAGKIFVKDLEPEPYFGLRLRGAAAGAKKRYLC
jgi:hypothetical protein